MKNKIKMFLFFMSMSIVLSCSKNVNKFIDDKKEHYAINYFENNNLKSIAKGKDDSLQFKLTFSDNETLRHVEVQSTTHLLNTGKKIDNLITSYKNMDETHVIADSFKLNEPVQIQVCMGSNPIPWVNECNHAFIRIAHESELFINQLFIYHLLSIKKRTDTTDIKDLWQGEYEEYKTYLNYYNYYNFVLRDHINSMNRFIKGTGNKFSPLYQRNQYLNINEVYKFKYKFYKNQCLPPDTFYTLNYKWNYGFIMSFNKSYPSDINLDTVSFTSFIPTTDTISHYSIYNFKTNENNCIEATFVFHEPGNFHINMTNVLPFKGVDLYSEDNNRPFMSFTTNDFIINVLPEEKKD